MDNTPSYESMYQFGAHESYAVDLKIILPTEITIFFVHKHKTINRQ